MSGLSWTPLDHARREIRLVQLTAGQWDEPIQCSSSIASLDAHPQYRALSYAWGEIYNTETIRLNGHSYHVTRNLHSALRRLRSCAILGPLWIDALSVNQADAVERSHQVDLMRDIFATTQEVFLWLGELEVAPSWEVLPSTNHIRPVWWYGDDRDALNLVVFKSAVTEDSLESLIEHIEDTMDPLFHLFCILSQLADRKHLNDIPMLLRRYHSPYRTRIFFVLSRLVASSWWYRIWILQEAILPPKATVLYGHMVTSWDVIARAALYFEGHRSSCCSHHTLGSSEVYLIRFVEVSRAIWQRRHTYHRLNGPPGLPSVKLPLLLWQFRSRQALDDRDKILALCGLVTDWDGHSLVKADYSLTAPQLYHKVALDILAVDKSLTILSGDLRRHNHEQLPSWVPDFSAPLLPRFQDNDRVQRSFLFNAAAGTVSCLSLVTQDILSSPGLVFEKVFSVGEVMWPSEGIDWSPATSPNENVQIPDSSTASTTSGSSSSSGGGGGAGGGGSNSNSSSSTSRWLAWKSIGSGGTGGTGGNSSPSSKSKLSSKAKAAAILALRRALCADCVQLTSETGISYRRLEANDERNLGMWAHLRFNHRSLPTTVPEHSSRSEECSYSYPNATIRAIDRSYAAAAEDSRLFITRSGTMGLGPRNILAGDLVLVLWGGRLPFIVRSAGERTIDSLGTIQCYSLIGGCYVNGIMDGEVMAQKERVNTFYFV